MYDERLEGSRSPVELVDVLDVAEQGADLVWFQGQSSAVDDAAQIVLQTHRGRTLIVQHHLAASGSFLHAHCRM